MTKFREQSTKTVTVTSTQRVSQCNSLIMPSHNQLLPTNSITRSTLSIPRPSPTSRIRETHQFTALAVSIAAPRSLAESLVKPSPTVVDNTRDQSRSLMCNTASTILAVVSGTLLLCLSLSIIGWMWTCCVLRRMRSHKQNTSMNE